MWMFSLGFSFWVYFVGWDSIEEEILLDMAYI